MDLERRGPRAERIRGNEPEVDEGHERRGGEHGGERGKAGSTLLRQEAAFITHRRWRGSPMVDIK